jgi:hypothetical protein
MRLHVVNEDRRGISTERSTRLELSSNQKQNPPERLATITHKLAISILSSRSGSRPVPLRVRVRARGSRTSVRRVHGCQIEERMRLGVLSSKGRSSKQLVAKFNEQDHVQLMRLTNDPNRSTSTLPRC